MTHQHLAGGGFLLQAGCLYAKTLLVSQALSSFCPVLRRVIVKKAEIDEMKSFVAKKEHERWLWHAIDHETGTMLAYVLGQRQDRIFLQLKR